MPAHACKLTYFRLLLQVSLAQIYTLANDKTQAQKHAQDAFSADSENLPQVALVFASLGSTVEAERGLRKGKGDLSPSNERLISGVLTAANGNTAAGIGEIRLAHESNPRDEEAAYQLAMAYLRAGDCGSAVQMFQAVEKLKGTVLLDNVPLLLPVSMYRIAECYDRLGNSVAAESYYAR